LRPAADREACAVWLTAWTLSPSLFPYGASDALRTAVDSDANPDFADGNLAYPPGSLGFYLQSAIAAGVNVRVMPWLNLLRDDSRGRNRDIDAYHPVGGGLGSDADRAPVDVSAMAAIPPELRRGFAIADDKTRPVGSHHQKATFVRNRYGDVAFLGGVDPDPSRWDTQQHRDPESRGEGSGWHDVHVMLEGPAVRDVVRNFVQRWNAFLADPPGQGSSNPTDVAGLEPIAATPVIDHEGVPDWPGAIVERDAEAPIDPPDELDRGAEGRLVGRATQICAVIRTIPPYIDAYDGFTKARPLPDDGTPLGELGCLAAFRNAIERARRYVYLEDQYFVDPELTDLLIERLTEDEPAGRLGRLFVVIPHVLADNPVNDAIYHHVRTQNILRIRQAVRTRIGQDRGQAPDHVPAEDVDRVFTAAHMQHPNGAEIYVHAKHMIVDDLWMVITSSNFSRRGMTYETEMGLAISDAAVEDGVRKAVRDQRIRLWAEHLRLDRREWHRLLDPADGLDLLRLAVDNPNLPLIEFDLENDAIPFAYAPEAHDQTMELIYRFVSEPDGREEDDLIATETAQQLFAEVRDG
jgi:phosphatidylserine/phosphatidylglycerophosphate/cardiolipin synthase-like enzyme